MKTLPPCDIETLRQIEAYAPHVLTPHDRHCLRMHNAAPAVRIATPWLVVLCGTALALLPWVAA